MGSHGKLVFSIFAGPLAQRRVRLCVYFCLPFSMLLLLTSPFFCLLSTYPLLLAVVTQCRIQHFDIGIRISVIPAVVTPYSLTNKAPGGLAASPLWGDRPPK